MPDQSRRRRHSQSQPLSDEARMFQDILLDYFAAQQAERHNSITVIELPRQLFQQIMQVIQDIRQKMLYGRPAMESSQLPIGGVAVFFPQADDAALRLSAALDTSAIIAARLSNITDSGDERAELASPPSAAR